MWLYLEDIDKLRLVLRRPSLFRGDFDDSGVGQGATRTELCGYGNIWKYQELKSKF